MRAEWIIDCTAVVVAIVLLSVAATTLGGCEVRRDGWTTTIETPRDAMVRHAAN